MSALLQKGMGFKDLNRKQTLYYEIMLGLQDLAEHKKTRPAKQHTSARKDFWWTYIGANILK